MVVDELRAIAVADHEPTRVRLRALELLGKYLGLFVDRSEVTHSGHISQGDGGLQALVAQVAADRDSPPHTN